MINYTRGKVIHWGIGCDGDRAVGIRSKDIEEDLGEKVKKRKLVLMEGNLDIYLGNG